MSLKEAEKLPFWKSEKSMRIFEKTYGDKDLDLPTPPLLMEDSTNIKMMKFYMI